MVYNEGSEGKMNIGVDIDDVRDLILDIIEDAGYDASEFSYVGIRAYGSRVSGRATEVSDLDILVEYEGSAREDDIFNVLHEEKRWMNGVLLDINPIKAECSGTIEEYLHRCDDNWKEHTRRIHRGR